MTSDDFTRAVKKLRAAEARRVCYFCKRRKPDAFVVMPVHAHAACVRKEQRKSQAMMAKLVGKVK